MDANRKIDINSLKTNKENQLPLPIHRRDPFPVQLAGYVRWQIPKDFLVRRYPTPGDNLQDCNLRVQSYLPAARGNRTHNIERLVCV